MTAPLSGPALFAKQHEWASRPRAVSVKEIMESTGMCFEEALETSIQPNRFRFGFVQHKREFTEKETVLVALKANAKAERIRMVRAIYSELSPAHGEVSSRKLVPIVCAKLLCGSRRARECLVEAGLRSEIRRVGRWRLGFWVRERFD